MMGLPAIAPLTTEATVEGLIERFLPQSDYCLRHETLVHAPADRVFVLAWNLDVQSHRLVRGILWLREKLHHGAPEPPRRGRGLMAEATSRGWGVLAYRPFREVVMGAITQPWKRGATIAGLPPEQFATYAEPDRVKIAWTIKVEPLGPALTRLRTEACAQSTDAAARGKFGRYWRLRAVEITLIRNLLLRSVCREAEQWCSDRRLATGRGDSHAHQS
jgi:hypothetical protein